MSGAAPLWEPDPAWAPGTDETWRGDQHPEADDPGWPEPESPSEYGLYRRDAEEEDGA